MANASTLLVCPECGTQVSPALLACPRCQRLTHGERLREIAQTADASDDPSLQLQLWREALDLLPNDSRQFGVVAGKVEQLSRQIDTQPGSSAGVVKTRAANVDGWRSNGKMLFLGLIQLNTLLTMLLAMVVYWTLWTWPMAIGVVISIYIHEMGHVAVLRRFGFKASNPFFLPGLGALIQLKQRPINPQEDARIGLAGPIWGLAAAVSAAALWLLTGHPAFAAIAKIGAWINLFNLVPIPPLDGGRGFAPMSQRQQWLCVAALGASWFFMRDGMLGLITLLAVARLLGNPSRQAGDRTATWQYLFLVATLSALAMLPVRAM